MPFIIEVETERALTYAACAQAVQRLQREIGAEPRTIALALPGGIASAIVWLAALTGGHRLVPCTPEATSQERARLGETQHPDVLVAVTAEDADGFARPAAQVITSAEIYALATAERDGPVGALPFVEGTLRLTTSGTTGEPKGVALTARQIAWTAEQVRDSHHLTPLDRGLCVLPFFHINAPVVSLCATLTAGATVVIAPRFSLRHFWEWIARERITWASIVPTIVALLLATEKPAFLPGTLRFVRTASAPLPAIHQIAFERRFGIPVIETYGLSEAASQVAANPVPPGQHKPGSVGVPTGVAMRICAPRAAASPDGRLRDVVPGTEGEICVRGPNVIASYEGNASADAFYDGWFRTGDLGYRDADGYLFITGRLRDVINRGGEKVSPREIEEVLLAHPAVRDVAVIGAPDPLYGQRVVAYVVPRQGHGWSEHAEGSLRAYCAERLSAYKVPEAIYVVETLPRNGNGKLARQQVQCLLTGQREYPPHTEMERDGRQEVLVNG